jgi:hypothetical protein
LTHISSKEYQHRERLVPLALKAPKVRKDQKDLRDPRDRQVLMECRVWQVQSGRQVQKAHKASRELAYRLKAQ